ncbi:MAG TPA: hypothetical protein PLO23_03960 [Alphaproteobacteria bacterium]|nr:hypothetical protein [Alphaproteobacteria bacterium]
MVKIRPILESDHQSFSHFRGKKNLDLCAVFRFSGGASILLANGQYKDHVKVRILSLPDRIRTIEKHGGTANVSRAIVQQFLAMTSAPVVASQNPDKQAEKQIDPEMFALTQADLKARLIEYGITIEGVDLG